MKLFLKKILFFGLLTLITLCSVNYFGDAAKLFDDTYHHTMIEILNKNHNVTNVSNFNEVLFKKELIKNEKKDIDILVLGSSRTMLINSSYYNKKNLINASVSGAYLEDIISLYQSAFNDNKNPKEIILNIDPWIFNKNNGSSNNTRGITMKKELESFLKENSIKNTQPKKSKYFQLISPSYFQSSFKALKNSISKNSAPLPSEKKLNETNTYHRDGSLSYGEKYRNAIPSEIDLKAKDYIEGNIYCIENFNSLAPNNIELFNLLIKNIQKEKSSITFSLIPYHPLVYKKIETDYPLVLETEKFISEFSVKYGIKIIGSYNPIKCGLNNSFFYDGMHLNEKGINEIMNFKK